MTPVTCRWASGRPQFLQRGLLPEPPRSFADFRELEAGAFSAEPMLTLMFGMDCPPAAEPLGEPAEPPPAAAPPLAPPLDPTELPARAGELPLGEAPWLVPFAEAALPGGEVLPLSEVPPGVPPAYEPEIGRAHV